MPARPRQSRGRSRADDDVELADRLHSAAVRLLRRLRAADTQSGLTGPQLSALSVIVYRGPIAIGVLADAEQVRPPTISRLVRDLEARALISRVPHEDARVQLITATALGERLLREGRARRVAALALHLRGLTDSDRAALERAIALMDWPTA